MATLNPASAAAIARLRSYVPPPTSWHALPLTRRAAVLLLLFADRKGELRVVLTMRAATLKSYAGQAALPGGKSDTLTESPLDTARREAWEEIGLPLPGKNEALRDTSTAVTESSPTEQSQSRSTLPYPFRLEHLCQLPTNLAKTELGVRPCVAYLYATSPVDHNNNEVDVERMLLPRLDAKEVAAVFNARFHNFLRKKDEVPVPPSAPTKSKDNGVWYKGSWTDWYETKFRMHNFFVPIHDQLVSKPKSKGKRSSAAEAKAMAEAEKRAEQESNRTDQESWRDMHGANASSSQITSSDSSTLQTRSGQYPRPSTTMPYRDIPSEESDPLADLARFRVFGMTARILVDCARVAYAEEPEFEHNAHFGDEAIIERLIEVGRLGSERGKNAEFTTGELEKVVSGHGSGSFGGLIQQRQKRLGQESEEKSRL